MTLETTLGPIVFSFPEPTYVLLQDNRNWGDNFEVRVNYRPTVQKGSFDWRKEDRFDVAVDMVLPVETALNKSEPVTIEEGADWVKVDLRTGVRKGSAVDFTDVINRHAPAMYNVLLHNLFREVDIILPPVYLMTLLSPMMSGLLAMESASVMGRMTLHGQPAAKDIGGMSRVTTAPAPMTQPSPIVTPGQMTTLAPNQQSMGIHA